MIRLPMVAAIAASIALAASSFADERANPAISKIPAFFFNNERVRAARDACQGDVERLCGDVVPGGGRIIRCLAAQRKLVSPQCRAAIRAAREALGF